MPPRIRIPTYRTNWAPHSKHPTQQQCPVPSTQPARHLQTTTPIIDNDPPPPLPSTLPNKPTKPHAPNSPHKPIHSTQYAVSRAPKPPAQTPANRQPLTLTPSVRSHLPLLVSQPPLYATIHVHGRPYLVTVGDTVRLPFLMHGVKPGDVLRLDRATAIGSRDFTLFGGVRGKSFAERTEEAANPSAGVEQLTTTTTTTEPVIGKTADLEHTTEVTGRQNKKKGPPAYLDDRFFVCRAVVMGTESEPMRIKEKTKRRQRRVKRVRSKHRFTILRVKELSVRGLKALELDADV